MVWQMVRKMAPPKVCAKTSKAKPIDIVSWGRTAEIATKGYHSRMLVEPRCTGAESGWLEIVPSGLLHHAVQEVFDTLPIGLLS